VILSSPGSYRVQFVDCTQTPRFAAQWWQGAQTASAATPVAVGEGTIVTGIDAQLAAGAPGAISGRVVNVHGAAVTASCVVLYLPNQYALFAPVGSDGTYSITGAPSGTYALAFLGCPTGNQGDPSPVVPDPQMAGVAYPAVWWDDVPLDITSTQTDGGPDPIAQGADMVTITPGAQLTGYDHCFGCTAVHIDQLEAGPGSVTASFTTPGLLTGPSATLSTQAAPSLTYELSCRSSAGSVASVSGSASPLTVTLAPGNYACRVTAVDGSSAVATSADERVTVSGVPTSTPSPSPPVTPLVPVAPDAPAAPAQPAAPASTPAAGDVHLAPRDQAAALAFTGSQPLRPMLAGAVVCILVGVGFVATGRRRRGAERA
jgi:hypothetical protein